MWYLLEADPKSDLGIRCVNAPAGRGGRADCSVARSRAPRSLRNLYKGTSTSRKAFRLAKSLNQYHKLKDALIREVRPGHSLRAAALLCRAHTRTSASHMPQTGSFSRLAASVVGFGGMVRGKRCAYPP